MSACNLFNIKTKYFIIIIVSVIVIFVYLQQKYKREHLDSTSGPVLSNEAIQSISSVYSNTAGTVAFNNLNVTGWKGMIVMWSGTTDKVPKGWALCDGSNNTPDLRGRFIVGAGEVKELTNSSSVWGEKAYEKTVTFKMNETGGEDKHKLHSIEMPLHSHGHRHYGCNAQNCFYNHEGYAGDGGYARRAETDFVGGDGSGNTVPHNNMPPYYVLAYIIKV